MTEQDKRIVDAASVWLESLGDVSPEFRRNWGAPTIASLIEIIHSLDKQLTGIVEAGEPIEKFVEHLEPDKIDDQFVDATRLVSDRQCFGELGVVCLTLGQLLRLAQALKGVKDG